MCRICWSAEAKTDVEVSGKTEAKVLTGVSSNNFEKICRYLIYLRSYFQASKCCGYGTKGDATDGYDCIMIPGAQKVTAKDSPVSQCGGGDGLGTKAEMGNKTVCCKNPVFWSVWLHLNFLRAAQP